MIKQLIFNSIKAILINTLKVLKGDELVLKDYIIIPDSIKQVTRGLKFVLAVDYENNERLLFDLKILNNSSNNNDSSSVVLLKLNDLCNVRPSWMLW